MLNTDVGSYILKITEKYYIILHIKNLKIVHNNIQFSSYLLHITCHIKKTRISNLITFHPYIMYLCSILVKNKSTLNFPLILHLLYEIPNY